MLYKGIGGTCVVEMLSEFVLRTNRKWTGTSKWGYRTLKEFDEVFAIQFAEAFGCYY
jgi:hypothetical protein